MINESRAPTSRKYNFNMMKNLKKKLDQKMRNTIVEPQEEQEKLLGQEEREMRRYRCIKDKKNGGEGTISRKRSKGERQ